MRVEVSSTPSLVMADGSSAARALPTQWVNTVQMRWGLTRMIPATRLTGISRSIKASARASNSSVKPLPGRAHGTATVTTFRTPDLVN